MTLVVIFALAEVFAMLGDNISKGRSIIEMSGQLRSVAHRLQQDLDGATANTLPWSNTSGYLEYIERVRTDKASHTGIWGDFDDVLMFTARSKGRPFVGRYNGNRHRVGAGRGDLVHRLPRLRYRGTEDARHHFAVSSRVVDSP